MVCAPETKPQVEALRVIMAAGAAMDGQRGSLCTDTPRWKGERVGRGPQSSPSCAHKRVIVRRTQEHRHWLQCQLCRLVNTECKICVS